MFRVDRKTALMAAFLLALFLLCFLRYFPRNAVPVSDGPLSDMLLQMLPQRHFIDTVTQAGGRPMWNPMTGVGSDELTTLWFHPYYPTTILTRWFGLGPGMVAEIFLHILLAFAGMLFYLRNLGKSSLPSMIGATAFAGSGMIGAYCFAPVLLMSAAWLPLMIYGLDLVIERKTIAAAAFLGLVTGVHTLCGMVQYTLYFALLMAAYFAVRVWRNRESLLRLLVLLSVSALLAGLIGAGKLLPWIENMSRMRGGYFEYRFFADRLFSAHNLLTVIAPTLLKGRTIFEQISLRSFVGLVPLGLAIYGAVKCKQERVVRFYAITFVAALLLMIDWPPVRLLWSSIKIFASLTPTRMWTVAVFALAVLGAFGAQALMDADKKRIGFSSKMIIGLISCCMIMAAVVLGYLLSEPSLETTNAPALRSMLLVFCVCVGSWIALVFSAGKTRVALLACIAGFNAFAFFWSANPARHLNRIYADTPITRALAGGDARLMRIGRPFHFINGDRVYEAMGLVFQGVHDVHAHALMVDAALLDRFDEVVGPPPENSLMFHRRTRALPPKKLTENAEALADQLHVAYFLVDGELAGREPIASDGRFNLYKRGEVNYPLSASGDGLTIKEHRWQSDYNAIDADVVATANGTLTLHQGYRKHWKATVDGQSRELKSAGGLSMTVTLAPGDRKVRFEYSDPAVALGDKLTLLGYLMTAVIFAALIRRRKERPCS